MNAVTYWNGNPPPEDGTVIVAVGSITSVEDGEAEIIPYTGTIRWDSKSNEWMDQFGLTLRRSITETVNIHHWQIAPTEEPVAAHPHVQGLLPVYLPENMVKFLTDIFDAEVLLCPEGYGSGEQWLAPSAFIWKMVVEVFRETGESTPEYPQGIPYFIPHCGYHYEEHESGLTAAHEVIERWKSEGFDVDAWKEGPKS